MRGRGFRRRGWAQQAGPYLLGGCEARKGAEVGVCDQHRLWKQACVRVLGHLRLVAVQRCEEKMKIDMLPGPIPEGLKTEYPVRSGPGAVLWDQMGEKDLISSLIPGACSAKVCGEQPRYGPAPTLAYSTTELFVCFPPHCPR